MPTLEEIDGPWILRQIQQETPHYQINVHLSTVIETGSGATRGRVTVSRDVAITPAEVLAILAARPRP